MFATQATKPKIIKTIVYKIKSYRTQIKAIETYSPIEIIKNISVVGAVNILASFVDCL